MLSPDDFAAFFKEIHDYEPFPWQTRLLKSIAAGGKWPGTLDLPTGSGKTAAIDVAVFHLSLEADRAQARRAPVRIAFVVDRRLVVDDAFERAKKIADALNVTKGPVTKGVAEQLRKLSGDGPALIARRLRGGIPHEDDWARTPSQPTVLCSTVDQVGSRLLFRGYGVSASMTPIHAGLIGSDCLILLDEAHLAEPFRQTLEWTHLYRGATWREVPDAAPWGVAHLTATPGHKAPEHFSLDNEDTAHPVLHRRLNAAKSARFVVAAKARTKSSGASGTEDDETASAESDLSHRASAVVDEIHRARQHFKRPENGAEAPALGIVVNRVARARAVFELLKRNLKEEIENGVIGQPILMIGPARAVHRDELVSVLDPIRTRTWKADERRTLDKPLIVVATQCIEAGVDIDLDGLITEAAPVDALRQRFGRLNRAGRHVAAYAVVIAAKTDLSVRYEDPVYGKATRPAWDYFTTQPDEMQDGLPVVNVGLAALDLRMQKTPVPPDALSEKYDAPILLPAHLDLLSQTSPIPSADPEVALYLHGPKRQPDSVTVVWRADIDPGKQQHEETRRLLTLVPPRASEAIELPVWAVRRWLTNRREALTSLGDIAAAIPDEEEPRQTSAEYLRVFRWRGDNDLSRWVMPSEVRPGDTIVALADYGGVDEFGWNPEHRTPSVDIGRQAAAPFAGRRFAVRVAPGLVGESVNEALADVLAGVPSQRWQDVRASLEVLPLHDSMRQDLQSLDNAKKKSSVACYLDVYGTDDDRPRGALFVAPFGIKINSSDNNEDGRPPSSEDDTTGSLAGFPVPLAKHIEDVEKKAEAFAKAAGLSAARVADVTLAAHFHDAGKADRRFQSWLYYDDPFGLDSTEILAKSGRLLPRSARGASGLPEHWRHEALSVRLSRSHELLGQANDAELVLWLVGTHHGHGRPLFPHCEPTEKTPDVGPQSLAFDWRGADWPALFDRLKARYGIWELARMEAILRLADHRASEDEARESASR